ncbi:MAG: UDP-N-acetylmuramoyl-tripeptide--D-alanyl-D-alanine ligase [Clostridia bacterium]|nr:UDP-N-acetylmuramoyl-tripeptide--D-alanyl-D-alanine ligase [Clostridia bacterium]
MQRIKCEEVLKAVQGVLISGDLKADILNISTDSRKINEGDLFIPISGEKFDGHDFIDASLDKGAAAALTHKDKEPVPGKVIIRVEDTLKALGSIAAYYRQKFKIPVIGVTGSVGKTSTKDMIASALSHSLKVLKTEGNFNNEIGLPLTVFNLAPHHEAAVIEMGMSGFGEISRLTNIAKPDVAVITNIGMSHIEKLGSRQGILKAKMEILEGLSEKGLVVLNGDDHLLYGTKGLLKFRTVFYGMEEGMDYHAYNVKSAGEQGTYFEIAVGNSEYKVHVPSPGVHNVYNALAAIAVGSELGVPMDKIIQGIKEFSPSKMRLSIISLNGIKVINDAYNASPNSMEAAIDVLKDLGEENRTIAVLGDMLELGDWAERAHRDIGKYLISKQIDYIITVGENARAIASEALTLGASKDRILPFQNNDEIKRFLEGFVEAGDTILVKGSRGMKMEEIVEHLTKVLQNGVKE